LWNVDILRCWKLYLYYTYYIISFWCLRNFSVVCLIFTSDTIINAKVITSLILFVHVLFFIYCFNVNQTQTSSCKFVLWLIEFVEISSGSFTHSFCKYLPPRISCTLLIQIVRRFYFYFPSSRLLCGRFRFRPRKKRLFCSLSIDILRENGRTRCATLEGENLYIRARREIGKWNSHRPLILSCNVERRMTFGHANSFLCNFLGMESIVKKDAFYYVWKYEML